MQVSVKTVKIPICFHSVLVLNIADPLQVLSDDQLLLSYLGVKFYIYLNVNSLLHVV